MHPVNHLAANATLALGSLAALATLATSQGTVTILGKACGGGPIVCAAANPGTTTLKNLAQNTNTFALLVPVSSSLRVITGFQLFTQSRSASALTIGTQILGADTAGKPGAVLKSGTMKIGTAAGWYTTTFTTPLLLAANKKTFLSYTPSSGMYFPIAASGTKVTHFWHSPTQTSWNGRAPNGFVTQFWAWKLLCGSSSGPAIGNTGVPTLNTSMSVDLSRAPKSANAIFALGISDKTWGTVKLPLDLTPLNAAGCSIYVSLDFVFLIKTTAAGTYKFPLTIPNNSANKGFTFYTQYAMDDKSANGMGISFTDYAKLIVG